MAAPLQDTYQDPPRAALAARRHDRDADGRPRSADRGNGDASDHLRAARLRALLGGHYRLHGRLDRDSADRRQAERRLRPKALHSRRRSCGSWRRARCAGSPTACSQLVIFRALQGLGAGVMQTMAFTTIADLYPPAKRGRVIGFAASVFGLVERDRTADRRVSDGRSRLAVRVLRQSSRRLRRAGDPLFLLSADPGAKAGELPDRLRRLPVACRVHRALLLALSWGGRDYSWTSPVIL